MAEKVAAEYMAENQRSISVSEFFAKNRHLLGFDNPLKALMTTIKEAVDNSLTEDMPLVIRKNGYIQIVKIGDFIDNSIEINKKEICLLRDGDLEKLRLNENVEVMAFDPKTLKSSFKKVSCLYRHKVNSDIFRLTLESGRYVELTPYHSVFTFKKGKVCSVKLMELKDGDSVVVPRNNWIFQKEEIKLNLLEELLCLDVKLTEKINVYNVSNVFTESFILQLKSILPKEKYYQINDFKRFSYLPLNLLRELKIPLSEFDNSKIGFSLSRNKIPCIINLDKNFARLMGFYVSEGSILDNLVKISFSFGSHELDIALFVKDLAEKVFNLDASILKVHKSTLNVVCYSKILGFVMKHILNFGIGAKNKQISKYIFNMNYNNIYDFLLAYLAGDGYPSSEIFEIMKSGGYIYNLSKQKIISATVSRKLHEDLQFLLSMLGLSYSQGLAKESKREILRIKTVFSKSYYLYIYTNQSKSNINKIPVNDSIISVKESKLKYSINRSNQQNVYLSSLQKCVQSQLISLYEGCDVFLDSDLGLLNIKSIEKIDYKGKWVYDISVPDCENFLGGVGPVYCHNSLDAAEEAGILPSLKVEIHAVKDREDRYIIIVEDNGPGIVKEQIPNIFGKLLYGSKFHTKRQQRGQQGIGISAAAMYGQLTTGKGIKITSRISKNSPAHYFYLQLNTNTNEAEIVKNERVEWDSEHGIKLEIELEAKYQKGKKGVEEFLKQTSVANPHCMIEFLNPLNEKIIYPRATDKLPKQGKEIKPHPYGIELGVLINMLKSSSASSISGFLQSEFCRVSDKVAKEICDKAGIYEKSRPSTIARNEVEHLFDAIQKVKIMAPPTDCLSPIGEQLLDKSLRNEYKAEFYTAVTRSPVVYRGIPFQIEVSMCYGGDLEKEEIVKVVRLANRVPLLYQQGACSINKAILETNWRSYGLNQSKGALPTGPCVIVVHIASVWVPFTSESKEAIAHYPDIIKEMKLALQDCGRDLAKYIRKNVRIKEQKERAGLFEKYIPEVAVAISKLSEDDVKKINEKLMMGLRKNLPLLVGISHEKLKEEIEDGEEKQITLAES